MVNEDIQQLIPWCCMDFMETRCCQSTHCETASTPTFFTIKFAFLSESHSMDGGKHSCTHQNQFSMFMLHNTTAILSACLLHASSWHCTTARMSEVFLFLFELIKFFHSFFDQSPLPVHGNEECCESPLAVFFHLQSDLLAKQPAVVNHANVTNNLMAAHTQCPSKTMKWRLHIQSG